MLPPPLPKTDSPKAPSQPKAPKWSPNDEKISRIRRDLGNDAADWMMIPPEGVETAEFAPPVWLAKNYGAIFAWKSAEPASKCVPNPQQRVQMAVLLRSD